MEKENCSSEVRNEPKKIRTQEGDRNNYPPGNHRDVFSTSRHSVKKRKATIKGQVMVVGDFPRKLVNSKGIIKHSGVILRTKRKRHLVHLGPAWYFWKQDFPIKVGDVLEVSGLETSLTGRDRTIMAEKVSNQGKTLKIPKKF